MDVGRRKKRRKEDMNNVSGMCGICALPVGETGSGVQRRNDSEAIKAEVVFVKDIVVWTGNKNPPQRLT